MNIKEAVVDAAQPDRGSPWRKSFMGHDFRVDDSTWKLCKDITIPIRSLLIQTPDSLKTQVKAMMAFFSERYSSGYVKGISVALGHLFAKMEDNEFSDVFFVNYRASSKLAERYLSNLRSFFRQWYRLGYLGMTKSLVDMLDSWRIAGAARGEAVKRLDATEGPFSDLELESFNDGAVAQFELGEINIEELSLSLLMSHTGRRPIQITHLKICDIWSSKPLTAGSEEIRYFVNIPRVKQGLPFRTAFKAFEITRELWSVLTAQSSAVTRWYLQLGGDDQPVIVRQLPLFPGRKAFTEQIGSPTFCIKLQTDALHMRSSYVTKALKKVSETAGLCSHRTEEELHVFARRFRYTIGTRGAREGLNKYVIAELLDHSDIQHVDAYTLNVPEHVKRIDEAVAYQLISIAQAFSGVLVNSEGDALRGHDSRSRIRNDKFSCGTCGHFGFCGALAPISCYTCIHFQAWMDAPHEEVLRDLISERERIIAITGDMTIAAVNDRTIFAVAEVVKRCESRRKEMGGEDLCDE